MLPAFKFRLLFMLLLSVAIAVAQEPQRFIEVIVSDTIAVLPAQFTYQVTLGDDSKMFGFMSDKGEEGVSGVDELEGTLKIGKFNYIKKDKGDYSISKTKDGKTTFLITLNSVEELEKLYNRLKTLKGISGKLLTDENPNQEQRTALYKKIFAKAKAQAGILAAASGNQLGRLISATETVDKADGQMEMVKQLWKNMSIDIAGTPNDINIYYTGKFQFRFELK